jgi:hypothetical protein
MLFLVWLLVLTGGSLSLVGAFPDDPNDAELNSNLRFLCVLGLMLLLGGLGLWHIT